MVTFSSILGEIVTNANVIMKYPFQIEKSDLRNLKILYKYCFQCSFPALIYEMGTHNLTEKV